MSVIKDSNGCDQVTVELIFQILFIAHNNLLILFKATLTCDVGAETVVHFNSECCGGERPVSITITEEEHTTTHYDIFSTDGGAETAMNSSLSFNENGTNIAQLQTYNPKTKEAFVKVPAHSNYGDNSYVMVGSSSSHPLAGKMMSVEGGNCELHDIHPDMNPEDLSATRGPRAFNTRNSQEVKKYMLRY